MSVNASPERPLRPPERPCWIGVAFRRGNHLSVKDSMIMTATWGPFVHCEVVLGRGTLGQAYSAYEGVGGFLPSKNQGQMASSRWVLVPMLLRDGAYNTALAHILYLLSLRLPYNSSDLWQCCIKAMLPFEEDLDCDHPDTWRHGVFCSQVALLLLRRLALRGCIQSMHTEVAHRLFSVNSRGCSPNSLHQLLT